MLYQQMNTQNNTEVGEPGPLPAAFEGVPNQYLANLDNVFDHGALEEMGFLHRGFVPFDDTPPPPVLAVKKHQAKIALLDWNPAKLQQAIDVVEASEDQKLKIYFNEAEKWAIDNEYVLMMAQALEIDEEQLQTLFQAASVIP